MRTSIYTSGFNLIKNGFNYSFFLERFCKFADECCVAVNTSEDDTLNAIKKLKQDKVLKNLVIVETNFSYEDPLLDGKIKNAALQVTTGDVKFQFDLDESPLLSQKELWEAHSYWLLKNEPEAMFVPVVNFYGNLDSVKDVNFKWRIHKPGLFRGPVNFAKRENGHVNITQSDTTELINKDGNLVQTVQPFFLLESTEDNLQQIYKLEMPIVYHFGYLDLNHRAKLNQNFWKKHWSTEAGEEVDIPTNLDALKVEKLFKHKLPLEEFQNAKLP